MRKSLFGSSAFGRAGAGGRSPRLTQSPRPSWRERCVQPGGVSGPEKQDGKDEGPKRLLPNAQPFQQVHSFIQHVY